MYLQNEIIDGGDEKDTCLSLLIDCGSVCWTFHNEAHGFRSSFGAVVILYTNYKQIKMGHWSAAPKPVLLMYMSTEVQNPDSTLHQTHVLQGKA